VTEHKFKQSPKLDVVPVYVRAGTVLPRQPLVQSTMRTPKGPLELDVYPGDDCRGELYFDDGIHAGGPILRQAVQCSVTAKGVSLAFGARAGKYRPWWKEIAVTVHGEKPARMTIADHPRAGSVLIAAQ
jgi:alpha-glucosidase